MQRCVDAACLLLFALANPPAEAAGDLPSKRSATAKASPTASPACALVCLPHLVAQRTTEVETAKDCAENVPNELQGHPAAVGDGDEINAPTGIAITTPSHLDEITRGMNDKLATGKLSRKGLEQRGSSVRESMRLVQGSLNRAHELIGSFKQVAVDQSSEQRRRFELKDFLEEVCAVLHPGFRRRQFVLTLDCPSGIEVDTYPSAPFRARHPLDRQFAAARLRRTRTRHEAVVCAPGSPISSKSTTPMTASACRQTSPVMLLIRSSPRGAAAAAPASTCTSSTAWSPRCSAGISSCTPPRAPARVRLCQPRVAPAARRGELGIGS